MALSKIQAESMNLADTFAFSGTVSGAGGGKVLQVKQTINNTPSTLSTSLGDVMSVQITPSASSSKILVLVNFMVAHQNSHSGVAVLYRGSTPLGGGAGDYPGSASQDNNMFLIRTLEIHNIDSNNMTYYDENANSASQLTYTLKAKSTGTTNGLYINRAVNTGNYEYNSSVMSTITAMEIGA